MDTFCDSGEDEVDINALFDGEFDSSSFGDGSFLLNVDLVADDHVHLMNYYGAY